MTLDVQIIISDELLSEILAMKDRGEKDDIFSKRIDYLFEQAQIRMGIKLKEKLLSEIATLLKQLK